MRIILLSSRIDGVRYGEIVGVDDEQLRIGRVAEAFRDGFGLGREIRGNEKHE